MPREYIEQYDWLKKEINKLPANTEFKIKDITLNNNNITPSMNRSGQATLIKTVFIQTKLWYNPLYKKKEGNNNV